MKYGSEDSAVAPSCAEAACAVTNQQPFLALHAEGLSILSDNMLILMPAQNNLSPHV